MTRGSTFFAIILAAVLCGAPAIFSAGKFYDISNGNAESANNPDIIGDDFAPPPVKEYKPKKYYKPKKTYKKKTYKKKVYKKKSTKSSASKKKADKTTGKPGAATPISAGTYSGEYIPGADPNAKSPAVAGDSTFGTEDAAGDSSDSEDESSFLTTNDTPGNLSNPEVAGKLSASGADSTITSKQVGANIRDGESALTKYITISLLVLLFLVFRMRGGSRSSSMRRR